jgi:toxin-antitoxin system PIN domain toxin
MLLGDTNVWLALAIPGHIHHEVSREWLDTVDEPGVIHFCRATQQSFLRLLTNRTALSAYGLSPLTNSEAWSAYAAFLGDDRIVVANREPDDLEVRPAQKVAPQFRRVKYSRARRLVGSSASVSVPQ